MAEPGPIPLDVVGRVLVEMGGDRAEVDARGDRIVVRLASLRAGASHLRRFARGAAGRSAIRRIHEVLRGAGLTLEVAVGRSTVGLLGVGARPGLASRALGLGPLEVRPFGVLGSFRRPLESDRPE